MPQADNCGFYVAWMNNCALRHLKNLIFSTDRKKNKNCQGVSCVSHEAAVARYVHDA